MDTFVTVIQMVLAAGGGLVTVRLLRGPTITDRIVALDTLLLLLAAALGVEAVRSGSTALVPAVVAVALVAFVGTVLVARFVEWRDIP